MKPASSKSANKAKNYMKYEDKSIKKIREKKVKVEYMKYCNEEKYEEQM